VRTARDPWSARRAARISREHRSVVGREDYLRVRLVERDGGVWADPLPGGSATLSNVRVRGRAGARRFRQAGLAIGDPVDVLLY
jgi:molybdopterin biosynthesis enzyme